MQATDFYGTIAEGSVLASPGDLKDSTAGNEAIWLSIAKGTIQTADKSFTVAGGTSASGLRTVNANWKYVEVQWLVKIKTDSKGDVHYEVWKQPRLAAHDQEQPKTVLTKPKILTVTITLREEERRNCPMRYVLSAADYQRLISAVA